MFGCLGVYRVVWVSLLGVMPEKQTSSNMADCNSRWMGNSFRNYFYMHIYIII